ncbi:transcriptional regulator [Desulforamulus aquiferis]|uniref:Transcriptional regulator n=1 Tax=Desulforamulus aquiferis TaxID=1397668 RepID=A0AAW7ZJB3_9FIRM|nr:transcriptional regulator [Desulforamulus aquiferis]MDO7789014.1 transcriptional regulator [Desulforamulus aquiferis]RYD03960.1 transcriptional regulator [Desulforamulus aquiferis]
MTELTMSQYFKEVGNRLPIEAERVLRALIDEGKMNKEELSLTAKVKRAVLDHVVMQLFALGLVDVTSEGKSKICSLTKLGEDYLQLMRPAI